ncbi:sensor histidine kinase [Natrarchaeobius oligotrophus]|uniref:histidine kinase n=1 Tax=Natrarchaeobius chitinivorans TaxID=1679083 RepID=A0A3N6MAK8_NATCH|nr:PAS domain S-box protein [Natrarchaeobius chitinivorans]RQH00834.1 PAS domain S-box protein [Natrarchaeobius chitinivorans]
MSDRERSDGDSFWGDVDDGDALERFEALVDAVGDGLYRLDALGHFVGVNETVLETTGYERADLLGAHVSAVLDDESVERIERDFRRRLAAGDHDDPVRAHEITVETADGDVITCDLRITLLVSDGTFRGSVGVVRDVTDRRRELERYETIVETIRDGVYVLDEEYRFVSVNEAYTEMTGYPRSELLGAHCSLVVDDDVSSRAASASRELACEPADDAATIEADIRRADGDRLPAESRFTPLPSPDGSFHGTVGVVRDVTERREYERKLEASNERLEQFAYAASHDLQEPLRMITSYLQLLERRYGDAFDDDGEEFLAYAVDGADRMREMIDGLLAYSRVDTQGEPFESVDLDAVLADACRDLQFRIDESGAELAAEPLPRVRCDGGQIRQVFQNLLENAIAYSGEGSPRIDVSADRTGSTWRISVRDDGVGIDPADADRAFEMFQRFHAREEHAGTGIGLALCKRIVERHGGEIRIDSEPGEGATVSFTLPVAEP